MALTTPLDLDGDGRAGSIIIRTHQLFGTYLSSKQSLCSKITGTGVDPRYVDDLTQGFDRPLLAMCHLSVFRSANEGDTREHLRSHYQVGGINIITTPHRWAIRNNYPRVWPNGVETRPSVWYRVFDVFLSTCLFERGALRGLRVSRLS